MYVIRRIRFVFILFCCHLCLVVCVFCFFFFKQKRAYEMRISDWSSDVCSSDLLLNACAPGAIASALRAPRTRPVAASNHRVERPLGSHSACCRILRLIGSPALRGRLRMRNSASGKRRRARSDARREGKEGVRTGRIWWAPRNYKKKNKNL